MKNKKNESPLKLSFILLYLGWTLIIAGLIFWARVEIVDATELLARREAFKGFEKDVVFRQWASIHGGVYVPVTEYTQPNPYLEGVKERDIVTPSGKRLTLMNPAYITRQVNEIALNKYGVVGHITSLKPIRKENTPDDWETEALNKFEKGEREYYGFDTIGGKVVYRYMGALVADSGCLRCHGVQGYKVGDIRGGISSNIPWENYSASIQSNNKLMLIGYGFLWLIGMVGLVIVQKNFGSYIKRRNFIEDELIKLNTDLIASKTIIEENLQKNNVLIDELTAAKEKLQNLNATKDKFFSIIAHDLKSPFQGFLGLTHLMVEERENLSEEKENALIENMHKVARNLNTLLTNLLEWAQMQKGTIHFSPVEHNLKKISDTVVESIHPRCSQKGIEIINKIEGDCTVYADEKMLRSVFSNLIANAVKFTQRGGKIEIQCKQTAGNMLEVSVKDSGIGIEQADIPKLFKMDEKFGRKGTEGEESTGLGLILCREFVEKNGGHIRVESEPGVGSTFYFTLKTKKNS